MGKQGPVNIIGAGMGGLAVAAYLARNGVPVRVFERLGQFGGFVHTFTRGDFKFEASTHQIGGLGTISYLSRTFEILGLADLEVIRSPHLYEVHCAENGSGGSERYLLPADRTLLVEMLKREFGEEHRQIDRFFERVEGIATDVLRIRRVQREKNRLPLLIDAIAAVMLKKGRPGGVVKKMGAMFYKHLAAAVRSPFHELLEPLSPTLRFLLAQYWSYSGTSPSVAPAVIMATILYIYLYGGPYHIKGGTGVLVDRLVELVRRHGGEVHQRSPVARIDVQGNEVQGVVTEQGERYPGKIAISNISTQRTFIDLIGEHRLPEEYVARIKGLQLSRSGFQLFGGVELRFEDYGFEASSMFFNYTKDLEATYLNSADGPGPDSTFLVTNYSALDESFAPPGCSSFTLLEFDQFDRWEGLSKEQYAAQKRQTQNLLIDKFERVTGMPLKSTAVHLFSGTPKTFARYSSGLRGELFGPAATLEQTFAQRTAPDTPIDGLYLVGAYTQPAHGVSATLDGGVSLGRTILGRL